MDKRLRVVWWDGSLIGHLVQRGTVYFVYDPAWLARELNISPLALPFTDFAFNGTKGVDGLPGVLADCLPDAWGRKVARADFAKNSWGEPSLLGLLAWRGRRGLGAIFCEPSLESSTTTLEKIGAAALARGALAIERGCPCDVLPQLTRGGTAGGAMPKALVLAYADGSLCVGEPDGEGVPSILKLDLRPDGAAARLEHAFALMARAAGLSVVTTRLVTESPHSSQAHLLVQRFDVPAPGSAPSTPRRFHFHSAAGLLHRTPDSLDYTDLFRAAIQLALTRPDIYEIACRMVFNVLVSNLDDHGKNHAFLLDEVNQRWTLPPAYDITFSSAMLQRGMSVAGEVWPSSRTMETLCGNAGLSRAEYRDILAAVTNATSAWQNTAKSCDVPPALIAEVQTRLARMRNEVLGK
jgi:serine/threonine-protein kinase HipA